VSRSCRADELIFCQTGFVERRGGEKNSAQPCFPVPNIAPSPLMQPSYEHGKKVSVQN
jgi:hypothetical protein